MLPGGRLQPLELTADALIRTMRWEIGQEVTVGRLNLCGDGVRIAAIAGRPVHELGFYYALALPEWRPVRSAVSRVSMPAWNAVTSSACVGSRIDALPERALVPDFVRTAVMAMRFRDRPLHHFARGPSIVAEQSDDG